MTDIVFWLSMPVLLVQMTDTFIIVSHELRMQTRFSLVIHFIVNTSTRVTARERPIYNMGGGSASISNQDLPSWTATTTSVTDMIRICANAMPFWLTFLQSKMERWCQSGESWCEWGLTHCCRFSIPSWTKNRIMSPVKGIMPATLPTLEMDYKNVQFWVKERWSLCPYAELEIYQTQQENVKITYPSWSAFCAHCDNDEPCYH